VAAIGSEVRRIRGRPAGGATRKGGVVGNDLKTDRKDARGLAQLIRMRWFRPVHAKSMGSQEVRALLVARKQLLGRLIDVELSIRGILRGFWSEDRPGDAQGI
jgi:transposase